MFRKRRRPTPHFKIPPPFNPITGEHEELRSEGVFPYCAMMQIAEEDTYDDYVICRGFDPRIQRFIDYAEGNPNKPGISVAKPYGSRGTGTGASDFQIGEIYPAFLPIQGTPSFTPPSPQDAGLRLGQNPGVVDDSDSTGGHPADLSDNVSLLYDHNGKAVNWMLMDPGGGGSDTLIVKLPSSGVSGRSESSASTMPNGTCVVQTVDDETGEMSDDPGNEITGFNLSPNELEGVDPRDGTSPMYAFAVQTAGIYVLSPLPWTTQPQNIQVDTRWTTSGLDKKQILNLQLPVKDEESWAQVAARDTQCDTP